MGHCFVGGPGGSDRHKRKSWEAGTCQPVAPQGTTPHGHSRRLQEGRWHFINSLPIQWTNLEFVASANYNWITWWWIPTFYCVAREAISTTSRNILACALVVIQYTYNLTVIKITFKINELNYSVSSLLNKQSRCVKYNILLRYQERQNDF